MWPIEGPLWPVDGRGAEPRVADVMSRVVVCVRADLAGAALARLLVERGIGGAPVVDRDGRPVGVVSKTDVLRAVARGADLTRLTVDDMMMPVAFVVDEDATLARAAALMATEGIHRIPVVNRAGAVVGIVTPLDVARWLAGEKTKGAALATPSGA